MTTLYAVAEGKRHPKLRVSGQVVEVNAEDLEVASNGAEYVLPADLFLGLAPGRYDFHIVDRDTVRCPADLQVLDPVVT
jgi:hypothetical protein